MSCQFVYAVRADFSRCNVAVPDDPRSTFGISAACIVFLLVKVIFVWNLLSFGFEGVFD